MADAAKTRGRRRRRTDHFVAATNEDDRALREDDRAFRESMQLALAMSAAEAAGQAPPDIPPPAPKPKPPRRRSPPAPKRGSPTKEKASASRKGEAAAAPKRRKKSAISRKTSGALEEDANLVMEPTAYVGVESAPAARKFRAQLPSRGVGRGHELGWYATSIEAAARHDEAARAKGRRTNFATRPRDSEELPLFGRPPEPKRPPRAPWYETLIAERISPPAVVPSVSPPPRPPPPPAPSPVRADAQAAAAASSCAACRGKHCRHTCGRQTQVDGAY